MKGLRAVAPAKINLYLHVLGKDQRGYHLLESLIAFTEFGDRVQVCAADSLSLQVEGPFAADAGPAESNLVLTAAQALARVAGVETLGARIILTKNLPVAAGIGGGSSDAAAAMRLLLRLWKISLPADALSELALELGADVPVCLYGKPAQVGGVGEQIRRVSRLPRIWAVLANPGVPLATRDVFGQFSGRMDTVVASWPAVIHSPRALADRLALMRNDLQFPAQKFAPEIACLLRVMSEFPDCLIARMSGSGATCFGLFATRKAADAAASKLRESSAGWAVATKLRQRRPSIYEL